jgi:hypothetical protein
MGAVPLPSATYRPDVATVFSPDPREDAHWEELGDIFAEHVVKKARGPIDHILNVVRSRNCRTVVLEHAYVDRDYQSEYAAFWATRFADRPARAARVHFFSCKFGTDALHHLPDECGYLGYFVFRPTQLGAIGRTVIVPPEKLTSPRIRFTSVVDRPSLFGHPLEVRGVPFCQQDGELLRCAHAAAWICHYVAVHRRIIGRRSTADIARMPSIEGSKHRPLPSTGLTGEQLQGVFSAIGIPAFFYEVARLPLLPANMPLIPEMERAEYERRILDERVFRVVCKYLNSGFPVVVLTESPDGNHAFTLVGWEHRDDHGGVRLIACDDQVGPYEIIESPTADSDRRGTWKGLMIPLPAEVFLTGEAAESRARQIVSAELDTANLEEDAFASDLSKIAPHLRQLRGDIRVRSRLIEGRRLKSMAQRQQRHPEAVRVVRMADLPLWVWVVEFQDSNCRTRGAPCVLAEIVVDSTSHDDDPTVEILSTTSVAMDAGAIDSEDLDALANLGEVTDDLPTNAGASGAASDEPEPPAGPAWRGDLDGRSWRSLISDPLVSDREYGAGDPPPGTVSAANEG